MNDNEDYLKKTPVLWLWQTLSQILNPLEIQGNSEGYAFEVSMAIVFAPVGLNTPEWNYAAEMYTDQWQRRSETPNSLLPRSITPRFPSTNVWVSCLAPPMEFKTDYQQILGSQLLQSCSPQLLQSYSAQLLQFYSAQLIKFTTLQSYSSQLLQSIVLGEFELSYPWKL